MYTCKGTLCFDVIDFVWVIMIHPIISCFDCIAFVWIITHTSCKSISYFDTIALVDYINVQVYCVLLL